MNSKLTPDDYISKKSLVKGFKHIVVDPEYMGGVPALLERRVTVATILENIGNGMSVEDVSTSYQISSEQVREALLYASKLPELRETA